MAAWTYRPHRFWLLVLLLAIAAAQPARAQNLAEEIAAIESALADRDGAAAEQLARTALDAAELSRKAETLQAANLSRLLGDALFYQDRFGEAEPLYRRALSLREAELGSDHLDTAVSANDLAIVLRRQQRYAEAEPLYRKVLDIRETVLGPEHEDTARAAFWVSRILDAQGRWGEAAEAMGEAVVKAAGAFGATHPTTVEWMGERAAMLHDAGDLEPAELAYVDAIAAGEIAFETGDTRLAYTRQGLGNIYYATGRAEEAVPLFRAALSARDAALGAGDPLTLASADRLARALWQVDEIAEAEGLFRRLLRAREEAGETDTAVVADLLRWIGRAASAQNRRAEAELLFKQALAISEQANGPQDVLTAFDLLALGQLYSGQQRFVEARPLLQRAVAILEGSDENRQSAAAGRMALSFLELATGNASTAIGLAERSLTDVAALEGAESSAAADVMLALAGYRREAGDFAGAEREVDAALAIYGAVDPDGRAMMRALGEKGSVLSALARYDEALVLHRQALDALAARYGETSSDVLPALAGAGSALFALGDFAGAADYFERSTTIIATLAAIDAQTAFETPTGEIEDQAISRAGLFDFLIKTEYRLGQSEEHASRAFLAAQRVIESKAARALAQMSARQAAGDTELAALARERQDLILAWQRVDRSLTAALGASAETAPDLRLRLQQIDARVRSVDAALSERFPDFARLHDPQLPDLDEVRARLGDNDVLLFFADTTRLADAGFETYLWAVPKTGAVQWVRLSRPTGELSGAVRELRSGMGVASATRGPTALGQPADRTGKVLTAASQLYDVLLGPVADLIEGRQLVIVPSRSLSALPFHALVSERPDHAAADPYREARWLARDHAITVLPSVASILAPAGRPVESDAQAAYLAFANPLLLGPQDDRSAFERAGCAPYQAVDATSIPAETSLLPAASRTNAVDVAAVRALQPLPETSDEVCEVAEALASAPGSVHLGAGATEAEVKRLSDERELAHARIVHFATHGLLAGELPGLTEPAIVLTPPATATDLDDGLLTASEVATLGLDADWVILSACNTASSDGSGEALSGLARAFFYAGARALMVSHWPVSSEAAVRLATGTVGALAAEPGIGRAEALRRAMLAEIQRGGRHADPANWAPFVLVGTAG